eukprot:scaffold132_cov170-Amphora_coffeaeformis.AAC.5
MERDDNSTIPSQISTAGAGEINATTQATLLMSPKAGTEAEPVEKAGEKRAATTNVEKPRKRKTQPKLWSDHFRRLDMYKTTSKGDRSHQQGYCVYCEQACGDDPTAEQYYRIQKHHFGKKPKLLPLSMYARNCTNHLKKCEWAPASVKELFGAKVAPSPSTKMSTSPSASAAATASVSSKTSKTWSFVHHPINSITNYTIRHGLSKDEGKRFQRLFLEMVVDCRIPFLVAQEPSVAELVDFLRPGASQHIPSPWLLGNTLLQAAIKDATEFHQVQMESARAKGYYPSLALDGWQDVTKRHIEGVVLTYGPQVFDQAAAKPDIENNGIACAKMLEREMGKRSDIDLRICVTDDAGQMARARRIVARRHPSWLLLHCFAHQINLMVKAILNLPVFFNTMKQAANAASLLNKSTAKWRPRLYNIMETVYGKDGQLVIPAVAETRWNSCQAVLAAQLRLKAGLKFFVEAERQQPDWPLAFMVWGQDSFWQRCEEAELAIRPFCEASFLMQRDGNTLRLVPAACFYYAKHRLWKDTIKDGKTVNRSQNEKRQLIEGAFANLRRDMRLWLMGRRFTTGVSDTQGAENTPPVEFWAMWVDDHPEMATLAQFLLSAAVQSASCERLFKQWMQFHTKSRNRLQPEKTQGMALVRRAIRQKRADAVNGPKKPSKSKNRFVNPAPRLTILERQLSQNRFSSTQNTYDTSVADGIENNMVNTPQEDEINVEENKSDDDSNKTGSDEEEEDDSVDLNSGGEVMNDWLDALGKSIEGDPELQSAVYSDSSEDEMESKGNKGIELDATEKDLIDCFEESDEEIEELPQSDDKAYPQENASYFQSKTDFHYVRNDKIPLKRFAEVVEHVRMGDKVEFPSMISVYQGIVDVQMEGWERTI